MLGGRAVADGEQPAADVPAPAIAPATAEGERPQRGGQPARPAGAPGEGAQLLAPSERRDPAQPARARRRCPRPRAPRAQARPAARPPARARSCARARAGWRARRRRRTPARRRRSRARGRPIPRLAGRRRAGRRTARPKGSAAPAGDRCQRGEIRLPAGDGAGEHELLAPRVLLGAQRPHRGEHPPDSRRRSRGSRRPARRV